MNAAQCRLARAALSLSRDELATLAKVSATTIWRLEHRHRLKEQTVELIRYALEAAGIEMDGAHTPKIRVPADAKIGSAGVELAKRETTKSTARGRAEHWTIVARVALTKKAAGR